MNTARIYTDSKGNQCSIWQMVKREPVWAAKKVQEGEEAIANLKKHEWNSEFPKEDGDFYYSGKLPSGMEFVGIVQVFTDLSVSEGQNRHACVLIPPFFRGDSSRKTAEFVHGPQSEWMGLWAGPDFGLSCCCVG